jgi:hypothetical protein
VVQLHPGGTGFPFPRLLRLAGIWWRHSNRSPHLNGIHVISTKYKHLVFSESGFVLPNSANIFVFMILNYFCLLPRGSSRMRLRLNYDRRSVDQPVLVSGPWPDFSFSSPDMNFSDCNWGRPLWRVDGPVLWIAVNLWSRSLMTRNHTFLSHYNPRHWAPFLSPLTTRRTMVEVFYPASTRAESYSCSWNYFATYGQPASLFWYREPTWGSWPDINHGRIFAVFFLLGTLPDERMRLQFTRTIATGPCQCCHSRVQVPQNLCPYLIVLFETGFPFRRLLRLAGLRWKYSNPLPQRL